MWPALALLLPALLMARGGGAPASRPESRLLVSAAVSLSEALEECGREFERTTGVGVSFNFGASNSLARQIVNGAPADVFVSADANQMDVAERAGATRPDTRTIIVSNRLVVVVPAVDRKRWAGPGILASASIRRIALGDPLGVPAGVYARAWLERARLWSAVAPKVVPVVSVRAVLAAVAAGAADAGVVYRSDVATSTRVVVVFEVPVEDAPLVAYPAAVVRRSAQPDVARRFVTFLRSDTARRIFLPRGFAPPPGA